MSIMRGGLLGDRARIIIPRILTPHTCFADVVQHAAGCTLGNLGIEIVEGGELDGKARGIRAHYRGTVGSGDMRGM